MSDTWKSQEDDDNAEQPSSVATDVPLLAWLQGIELGTEKALLASADDTLLNVGGQIDHMLIGPLGQLSEESYGELLEQIATIEAAWGSSAYRDGFLGLSVRGVLPPKERAVAERIQAQIGTELARRLEKKKSAQNSSDD